MASDLKGQAEAPPGERSFIGPNRETLVLAGFLIYVLLLLVGTVGNLFEIEAITGFWLYR